MRILFINPITPPKITKVRISLGVAYLSAALKKAGHTTKLLCPWKFNTGEISNKIEKFKPEIVAFSTVSDQFELAKKIISFIHNKYSLPIVLGGTHPTVAPEECINVEGIRGICIGEGDEAIVEFVDLFQKKKNYLKTKNFWFKEKKAIIKNKIRPLIQNLDSLPFPDRDLFSEYISISDVIVEFMASRGCPFQCSYCVNKVLQGYYGLAGFVRYRSVNNLLKEIKEVLTKYRQTHSGQSPKTITFHDDTFTLNKKWLEEFSDKYEKEIKQPYAVNGRVETINDGVILLLKKSGCVELKIGLESGNERIRREMLGRPMSNKQIINAFNLCRKYGLLTSSFNMIGIPGESEKEIKDTINLNRKIKPSVVGVSIFRPYPGTKLYNICKENGWISNRKAVSFFEGVSVLDLPTITHEKISYYYKIFQPSIYRPTAVPFIKLLIFMRLYDSLLKLRLFTKSFMVEHLSREQKDFLMKALKR